MLVNENVIEQLCIDAGHARTQKARKYQMLGNVSITKVEYENENKNINVTSIEQKNLCLYFRK